MNDIAFSHRPQDGISIGIFVQGGIALLAASFVRKGDSFSRKLARRVITQRILSSLERGRNVNFVTSANSPDRIDARSIMRELRNFFKPDPTCNDAIFMKEFSLNEMSVRETMQRNEAWQKITEAFVEAVKTAKVHQSI